MTGFRGADVGPLREEDPQGEGPGAGGPREGAAQPQPPANQGRIQGLWVLGP